MNENESSLVQLITVVDRTTGFPKSGDVRKYLNASLLLKQLAVGQSYLALCQTEHGTGYYSSHVEHIIKNTERNALQITTENSIYIFRVIGGEKDGRVYSFHE